MLGQHCKNPLNMNQITLTDAFNKICEKIKTDASYRLAWEANIAMAFKDQFHFSGHQHDKKIVHEVANKAAAAFLDQLIGKEIGDSDGMSAVQKLHEQATPLA